MSEDPWADQRAVRDAALADLAGDDLADEYERGAIAMSWADLTGETDEGGIA